MQAATHLSITGRVQGVGYRAWFAGAARKAGLTGWVRNRHDGSVEAVICGDPRVVERFLTACWQGPIAARVEGIKTTEAPIPDTKGFLRHDTL